MKTAISLPDETFDRASRRASDLGMSRSEFFACAAQHYLDELDAKSLTGQIDVVLEQARHARREGGASSDRGSRCLGCRGRRVVIERSDIYWADLGPAAVSRPAKRHPVLVIQSDAYNASRLATVLAVVITSKTALATMPGNTFLPSAATGLPRDSVVDVTALVTVNKSDLANRAGQVPTGLMHEVDRGLRRVLDL